MSPQHGQPAIVLLGHGSRLPQAGEAMEFVADRLREQHGYDLVRVCYMEHATPGFAEALDTCVQLGARLIVVIPYFLHAGIHLRDDIPNLVQERSRDHPEAKVIVGPYLGFDESLVGLVHQRIKESLGDPER